MYEFLGINKAYEFRITLKSDTTLYKSIIGQQAKVENDLSSNIIILTKRNSHINIIK